MAMKIDLDQKQVSELYNKLKFKVNPTWVMLKEKLVKRAKKDKVCLYCGGKLKI